MASFLCPHCDRAATIGEQYCQACGKGLPRAGDGTPQVVEDHQIASTAVGRILQVRGLGQQVHRASRVLLWVAVIESIVAAAYWRIFSGNHLINPKVAHIALLVMVGVAAIFWALYIWSRRAPLAAAIAGLVIYSSLCMLNFVVSVQNAAHAPPGHPPSSLFGGFIENVIIIFLLGSAVRAGVRSRRIERLQGQA